MNDSLVIDIDKSFYDACQREDFDTATLLLQNGANVDAIVPTGVFYEKQTPMQHAIEYNKLNSIKFLLENGADVNAKQTHCYTTLQYACVRENLDTVHLCNLSTGNLMYFSKYSDIAPTSYTIRNIDGKLRYEVMVGRGFKTTWLDPNF